VQLGDGRASNGEVGSRRKQSRNEFTAGSSSRPRGNFLHSGDILVAEWLPIGASRCCAASESARMTSRTSLPLRGIGLFLVIVLALVVLKAPPDGLERGQLSQFLGRFHPLVVHLPIALVLLVAALECAGFFATENTCELPLASF